jgi:hypothetical protein
MEPLDAMIVDLSKNQVSGKRELRELNARKLPLLEKSELDDRLTLVGTCYEKAIELVPHLPERAPNRRDRAQTEMRI